MIRLSNITLSYGSNVLLSNASAEVFGGELIALLGRNGTGKSTLLRAVAGLGKVQGGDIFLGEKELGTLKHSLLAQTVSFVTTERIRVPNLYCRDVVALGRAPYTNWIGQVQQKDKEMVARALALVNMTDYALRTMDSMSDGECQRIMIARALAQDTPIILLDEPTAFLDLPNRYELCLLLRDLAVSENKCILFSTHDLDIALSLCHTIMLIDNPNLYSLPTSEMVTSGHIERLFQNKLVTFDAKTQTVKVR